MFQGAQWSFASPHWGAVSFAFVGPMVRDAPFQGALTMRINAFGISAKGPGGGLW